MRYAWLLSFLFLGLSPVGNPLSEKEQGKNIQYLFDGAQSKKFRVDASTPNLQNLGKREVVFVDSGTYTMWTREGDTIYHTSFSTSPESNRYRAKAWVTFNGANGAIAQSYNVASVDDDGVGLYGINFLRPFANTNFACVCTTDFQEGAGFSVCNTKVADELTVSAIAIKVRNSGNADVDVNPVTVVCYGD